VLRIFPLYYGVLIGIFVVLPALGSISLPLQKEVQDQAWYWTYLTNVRIARDGWSEFRGLGHFWSLAVEEQFYLVWPAIVLLTGRRTLLQVCGLLMVVSLLLRTELAWTDKPLAPYVLMPARMDALALGALLALAARDAELWALARRWAPAAGGAAGLALVAIGFWNGTLDTESLPMQTIGFTLTATLSGALLVAAVAGTVQSHIRRFLGSRPLRFLGHYSYGLYVFHNLIVFRIAQHVFSADQFPHLAGSQLPGQLLFIVIATGTTLGLALLSWYCWEQPFLHLKRLFPYRSGALVPGG
jgi:peptidoglycan/LPS O-acetylase OafA/YrhL